MKPKFQHLGFGSFEGSFLSYMVNSPKFGFHFHYHPEIEISYVLKGHGTRLVGDNVQEFTEGDLIVIGSGLPHTLISDELFNQSKENMQVAVIQFPKEIIDARSLEIVELNSISQLMKDSARGLHFKENHQAIGTKMIQLVELTGFSRYHLLLEILNDLSECNYYPIASKLYLPNHNASSKDRIGRVCTFIHENFCKQIEIAELAQLANMNEAAFCRFFKKMTGKTATTYINDLRIGKSCQLLLNSEISISESAYQSGYQSITHFNRNFIKRKKVTPSVFKANYMNKEIAL